MGLLNFFKKQNQKSPIEKFLAIIASVKSHTEFLLNDNFEGLDSKAAASKTIFQTIDKDQLKTYGAEQKNKIDKLNEQQHVLDVLNKEVQNGNISEAELQEITNSKEFQDYTSTNV
jgi:hypothetical protein